MDEHIPNDSVKADAATNAVSIFGQAGTSDEFPVLKAFQQYIDAEQAKARKRMLGLSVFFIVLLVLVVGMFTIILTMMLQRNQEQADRLMLRNQEQADRLLELALRERQAPQAPVAPVVVNQPSHQQDSLKPVLEQLANLASAIKENNKPAPQPVAQPVATPTDAQAEIQRKLDAELQKLAEARAKLKADQEQARKDEIERQRRRLYPEYYAAQDRAAAAAAAAERALAAPANPPASTLPAQPAVQQPPAKPVIETKPVALPAAPVPQPAAPKPATAASTPLPAPEPSKQPVATGSDAAPSGTVDYVLPVGTKKTKGVKWRVPIPE